MIINIDFGYISFQVLSHAFQMMIKFIQVNRYCLSMSIKLKFNKIAMKQKF